MTVKNLLRRAERLQVLYAPQVRECHCPHERDEPYSPPPGLIEIARRPGPLFRSRCTRCGGDYDLQITEVVVVRENRHDPAEGPGEHAEAP